MTLLGKFFDHTFFPVIVMGGFAGFIIGSLLWGWLMPVQITPVAEVDGCRIYLVSGLHTSYIAACGGQSVVAKTADRLQAGPASYDIHEVKE